MVRKIGKAVGHAERFKYRYERVKASRVNPFISDELDFAKIKLKVVSSKAMKLVWMVFAIFASSIYNLW